MSDSHFHERLYAMEIKLDSLLAIVEGKTPEYYTVEEASILLRCSKSLVRDRMRNGKLPFQRLGNSEISPILIRRIDILEMLK